MRYVPFLLVSVIFSQDVTRVSEFKTSTFMGTECDDTEYRNEWGRPNWKNYGQWLSECDSISTTYYDMEFAERRKKQEEERLAREKELAEPLDDLDLDAMWDNTVWVEIQDVSEEVVYETEYITAVAGVRGAEAEDEALAHLYYRKTMRGISIEDYKKAYGKLKNTRDDLFSKNPNHPKLKRMDVLILEIKNKIKNS